MIGSGDAGIENALGLAADPAQGNVVTILNRSRRFRPRQGAPTSRRCWRWRPSGPDHRSVRETTPADDRAGRAGARHPRRRGDDPLRPDHRAHGLGAAARVRRGLRRSSSPAPTARPSRSSRRRSRSTEPGIYVIGALAGYPLIKHCMNQGYDVVEFINGNTDLKPADEPILAEKFAAPARQRARSTNGSSFLRSNVDDPERAVAAADARVHARFARCGSIEPGEVIFERNDPGSSLFAHRRGLGAGRGRPGRSRRSRCRSSRARSSARSG